MKILVASDAYTFQTNGVANVVMTQVRELRKLGHSVKVIAPSDRPSSFREGDDYYFASVPALVYPDVRLGVAFHNRYIRELKEWRPDVIHIHTEAAMEHIARKIIRADRTPFVMTVHTDYSQYAFGSAEDRPAVQTLFRILGKVVYRGVDAVIAPSEKALDFPQLRPVQRTVVIPNGIHMETYQKPCPPEERQALYNQLGLQDNGKTLVVISRVSKEKNIQEILAYLPGLKKRVPDAQLVIVGDGPEKERLEAQCAEEGMQAAVRFTGRIPREEVYRYYAMGDVFVSASTFEVHSLTFLEAMARGLPLVCREDASLRGVLEHGDNGFIYRTEEEFDQAVETILMDDALRHRMKARALERAEDFSDRRQLERTLKLYEQILAEAGAKEQDSTIHQQKEE